MSGTVKSNEAKSDLQGKFLTSRVGWLAICLVCLMMICLAMNFIIAYPRDYKGFDQTETRTGELAGYDVDRRHVYIALNNGETYDLLYKTYVRSKPEFLSLDIGQSLTVVTKSGTNIVLGITSGDKTVVDYDTAVADLSSFGKTEYICAWALLGIGALSIVFLTWYRSRLKHGPKREHPEIAPHPAEQDAKHRLLGKAQYKDLDIILRRVKHTNQLIVNGYVYDEYTGLFEFPHTLKAIVNENIIYAGLGEDSYTFITVNGNRLLHKRRTI